MIFLLDTNTVSDLLRRNPHVTQQRDQCLRAGHQLGLCPPVHYEVVRGLLKIEAASQLSRFQSQFVPLHDWFPLTDVDWQQAARYWAGTMRMGRQLSTTDLLLAALAQRLNATIVSSDNDFDALPVARINWRES
ncbi:MAG: PIN domain-containing protein [Anaerolineae bacterium]|nr:PIN domain-containing protein [Anaerolineae bacterium]